MDMPAAILTALNTVDPVTAAIGASDIRGGAGGFLERTDRLRQRGWGGGGRGATRAA